MTSHINNNNRYEYEYDGKINDIEYDTYKYDNDDDNDNDNDTDNGGQKLVSDTCTITSKSTRKKMDGLDMTLTQKATTTMTTTGSTNTTMKQKVKMVSSLPSSSTSTSSMGMNNTGMVGRKVLVQRNNNNNKQQRKMIQQSRIRTRFLIVFAVTFFVVTLLYHYIQFFVYILSTSSSSSSYGGGRSRSEHYYHYYFYGLNQQHNQQHQQHPFASFFHDTSLHQSEQESIKKDEIGILNDLLLRNNNDENDVTIQNVHVLQQQQQQQHFNIDPIDPHWILSELQQQQQQRTTGSSVDDNNNNTNNNYRHQWVQLLEQQFVYFRTTLLRYHYQRRLQHRNHHSTSLPNIVTTDIAVVPTSPTPTTPDNNTDTTNVITNTSLSTNTKTITKTMHIDQLLTQTHTLLDEWLHQLDSDIVNNVNGGIRYIRPYLLPPIPTSASPSTNIKHNQQQQQQQRRNQQQQQQGDGTSTVTVDNPVLIADGIRFDYIHTENDTPMHDYDTKRFFAVKRLRTVSNDNNNNQQEQEQYNHTKTDHNKSNNRMKWEDEYDAMVKDGSINQPLQFDYTDPKHYTYPPVLYDVPPYDDDDGGGTTSTGPSTSYPPLRTLLELMTTMPQDDNVGMDNGSSNGNVGTIIREQLIHFNYSNPIELAAARKFRDAELPFKLYNVPEVTAANSKWTDEYLSVQFGTTKQKLQQKLRRKHNHPSSLLLFNLHDHNGRTTTTTSRRRRLQVLQQSVKQQDNGNNNRGVRGKRRPLSNDDDDSDTDDDATTTTTADSNNNKGDVVSPPHTLAMGTAQESPNNYFAFFAAEGWIVESMGIPPTRNNNWSYSKWAKHARYADAIRLNATMPHFYWQSGVSPKERYISNKDEWTFISKDLPSFSSKDENFFLFHPEKQKGIQCRFGERGVVAATHYDSGRNMVAMISGAKRYILSPPNQCSKIGIFTSHKSPIYRHSLLNFGHIPYATTSTTTTTSDPKSNNNDNSAQEQGGMSLEEQAWLQRAGSSLAVETVLKQGEVLYIPSHWFHYIISLQKSAQCNVRSGIDLIGNPHFGGRQTVEECLA